jgi:hypothetical protein
MSPVLSVFLESPSISFIIAESPPAVKVSHSDLVLLESATFSYMGIHANYLYLLTISALPCVSVDQVNVDDVFIVSPLLYIASN